MKKAFTLIELLIVVLIMWIVMAAVGKLFSYKDADRMNFDACYVSVYWKISNFFQQALSQRSVYTGSEYQAPNLYEIIFDKSNQEIKLVYSWVWVVKKIKFSWSWIDDKNRCYTKTYHTYFSWNVSKVIIKPGLQVDNATTSDAAMVLYGPNGNKLPASETGFVDFYYCDTKLNVNCLQKYKIEIDPRVYLFKTYFCVKLGSNKKCLKWSK